MSGKAGPWRRPPRYDVFSHVALIRWWDDSECYPRDEAASVRFDGSWAVWSRWQLVAIARGGKGRIGDGVNSADNALAMEVTP